MNDTHEPNCAIHIKCIVYHTIDQPCPGFKACDCGIDKVEA